MSNILVVDDELSILEVLTDILQDHAHTVYKAHNGIDALKSIEENLLDLVLLDVRLPDKGGLEVLEIIKKQYPAIMVIVISGHGNIDMAVRAVKMGAFDFLEKPISMERVVTATTNALKVHTLQKKNAILYSAATQKQPIIGISKEIDAVRSLVAQCARSDASIMIMGDNGTGKELVALEIHRQSNRSDAPFIAINCAAIPENLIESELFGYEKGAFTDARTTRRGKFELAQEGTLFLDEVADMSHKTQAKLLRVIQEMQVERLGSEKSIEINVRIITATNKNIEECIQKGTFREDLYYRLNVIPINIPPLKHRRADIALLAEWYAQKMAYTHNVPVHQFDASGIQTLQNYHWPGNIRELKNFIERITILSTKTTLGSAEVMHYLDSSQISPKTDAGLQKYMHMKLGDAKDSFERQLLQSALNNHGYNISHTARSLGIYPSNLHNRMRKLGIENASKVKNSSQEEQKKEADVDP